MIRAPILPPLRRTAADAEAFARVVERRSLLQPEIDRVRREYEAGVRYPSVKWPDGTHPALEMLRAAVERGAGRDG